MLGFRRRWRRGEGVAGAVSSGPPTYIYLLRLTLLLPSPGVSLSPAPSSFPLFPPTFVAFHPFRLFLYLFYLLLLRLFRSPSFLPRASSRPSFATHLPSPLSSISPRPRPFLNPDTLPPSFSPPSPRAISLPLSLSLGLYFKMLPPTNKPQTLCSFTQS